MWSEPLVNESYLNYIASLTMASLPENPVKFHSLQDVRLRVCVCVCVLTSFTWILSEELTLGSNLIIQHGPIS